MRVVLLKDVKGLGRAGDRIEIANGYGRNYLVPNGLALTADHHLAKILQQKRESTEKKAKEQGQKAAGLAQRLNGRGFEFLLPSDEKGNLYAGLKESEIVANIRKGEPEASETQFSLVDYFPLKHTGSHKVRLKVQDQEIEINVQINSAANGKGQKPT